jgi:hypothetical protein
LWYLGMQLPCSKTLHTMPAIENAVVCGQIL